MTTPNSWIASTLLLLASTAAIADEWRAVASESRLNFVPTFEGRSSVGQFREFSVRLRFDPNHPEQGRLQVTIDVSSADLNSADLNEAIRTSEWLDVIRHPEAEFVSSRIRGAGGRYVAEGALRLKGKTKRIQVPFDWQSSGGVATMRGRLDLDRTDFQIGTGEWADGRTIGRPVEVRFELQLERSS